MPNTYTAACLSAAAVSIDAALLLPPVQAGPAPHVDRYFRRLDNELSAYGSDAGRRAFLTGELNKWRARYVEYCAKVDAGQDTDPNVSVFDFISTMAGIDQRLAWRAA